MKKIRQVSPKKSMSTSDLLKAMGESGVMGGGRMAKAADILEKMIRDKSCTVFFGQAGAMVPGGMKNVLIDMLGRGWIDVFVTTGATLTHDLVEALGYSHLQGSERTDDCKLKDKNLDRMFDSYMPNEVYEGLEDFFKKHFDEFAKAKSIMELLKLIGSKVPNSILGTCYKNKIPIFCPALADSGIGLMIWGHLARGKEFPVRAFDDLKDIMDIAWTAKKAGVFYVGGGVPKNFIQQAMQLTPKAAEFGVQITTDRPEPGGSSGAELREGISWGKMSKEAKYVDLICDATIALPVLHLALLQRDLK